MDPFPAFRDNLTARLSFPIEFSFRVPLNRRDIASSRHLKKSMRSRCCSTFLLLSGLLATVGLAKSQQSSHSGPPKLTPAGQEFVRFMREQQKNVGFGSPAVSVGAISQILGVKVQPAGWELDKLRERVERDLRKNNIQVVKSCTDGNCGILQIWSAVKCGGGEFCAYSVSGSFSIQCQPLRLPDLRPSSAAVWGGPTWDYGVVSRQKLADVLSVIDELVDAFGTLYYKPGQEM